MIKKYTINSIDDNITFESIINIKKQFIKKYKTIPYYIEMSYKTFNYFNNILDEQLLNIKPINRIFGLTVIIDNNIEFGKFKTTYIDF